MIKILLLSLLGVLVSCGEYRTINSFNIEKAKELCSDELHRIRIYGTMFRIFCNDGAVYDINVEDNSVIIYN